jgi:hypothetical protein
MQEETYNSSRQKQGDASLTPDRIDGVGGASSPQTRLPKEGFPRSMDEATGMGRKAPRIH